MSQFHPPSPTALKDKVVVLTGGALGVGAALVRQCHAAGAHVFFGDILSTPGLALEAELSTSNSPNQVKFVHLDVTSYTDNLHLFDTAFQARGRIDHAVSVAGLGEQGNIVDPLLTLESVREEPRKSLSVLDVNLRGPIFFARIASVYLRQPGLSDKSSTVAADKSLTLVSSVAGFKESPGLFVYQSAKHGVLGLMRSLRKVLINATPQPIRTNAICPWMTRTRLVSGIEKAWDEAGLPSNSPEDVARIIVGALADDELNGEALYIEGGRAWAIEKNISDLQHVWLGQKQHDDLMRGQEVLGSGAGWLDSHQEK